MRTLLTIFYFILVLSHTGIASADSKKEIILFAAASMTDAMEALGAHYERAHEVSITPVYASSSALARQIEYGAPAELFVSASVTWMDYLEERNFILSDSRANLAGNTLILATAGTCPNPLDLSHKNSLLSYLKGKRLALGEPTSVPAGIYAAQALKSLSVYDTLLPNMIFSENVRMALSWVTRREADAGIVYASDLHAVTGVTSCGTFPKESHDTIHYPIALIKNRKNGVIAKNAQSFLAYLLSVDAGQILTSFGFKPPDIP